MSSSDLDVKQRHHYVWANYLMRWGRGTKNVHYITEAGNFAHNSVRGIVVDDFFYKTTPLTDRHVEVIKGYSRMSPGHLHEQHMSYLNDFLTAQKVEAIYRESGIQDQELERHLHALKCNLLENLHGSHERSALPLLAALADEQLDVLQDKQNIIEFMMYFGHQLSRTKTFRDAVIQALPRRNAAEIELADATAHSWWFLSYMFGMSIGFSLFANRHRTRQALLVNNTGIPFITSDQPVINVHKCVSETEFIEPKECDLYYPVSPRIAYIICESERFASGTNEVDEATVTEFNTKIAAQAKVHIIGDSKSAIVPFKKFIGRRYEKAHPDLAHKQLPQ